MFAFIKKLLGPTKSELYLRLGSLLVFLFLWYAVGVRYEGDSGSYIDAHIVRSPLYPLIIQFFGFFDSSLNLLVLFQLLFGLYAIHTFLITMREIFGFGFLISLAVSVFISYPYFFITVKQRFFIGNLIMTGAICYPLFLLATASIFRAVMRQKLRYYLYFILLTALLILTRRQFLFLYPFFGIVWLTLLLQKERILFSRLLLLAVFVFSIVATNLIEKTYQYIQDGRFSTIPFTGMQLLVMPMLVANESDEYLFRDEAQREIFRGIYNEMAAREITFNDLGSISLNLYNTYANYYDQISHHVIPQTVKDVLGEDYDSYEMDSRTVQMSLVLIKHHFKNYLKVYLKNIETNSGKKAFIMFWLLVSAIAFINYMTRRSGLSMILLFALIMQYGNYMLIALVEPIIWRYTIYTNQVLFALLALFVTCEPVANSLNGKPDRLHLPAKRQRGEGA